MKRLLLLVTLTLPASASAQSYFDLEAGRPMRLQDALVTPRYEWDIELGGLRYERLDAGIRRLRSELKASYGIAPFSEIELRVPYVVVLPDAADAPASRGMGGLGLGAVHSFGTESSSWPALAIGGEWVAPVGALAAPTGSYGVTLIATRTTTIGRVHLNVGTGSWSVRAAPPAQRSCLVPSGVVPPPGCGSAPPPDVPCSRGVAVPGNPEVVERVLNPTPSQPAVLPSGADPSPTTGRRWLVVTGVDHALALRSFLVSADVTAEQFVRLYPSVDLSSDVGVRWQWTPILVLDAGVTRHFAGPARASAIAVGLTIGIPAAGPPQEEEQ